MNKTVKKGLPIRNRQTNPVAGAVTAPDTAATAAGVPTSGNADLAPSPGSARTPEEVIRKSNLWRDNYNPLRGMTIARLMAIFEAAERGAYAELQLLLRKVEKRYPVLKALKSRRLAALEKLDWNVKVMERLPAGGTDEMAQRQQEYLKGRYELVKNLREAFGQLALAEFRGYAILQKHRYEGGQNAGAVAELYWLEPWCWSKDGYYGDFFYNQDSRIGVGLGSCSPILGEINRLGNPELPRSSFVVREVESPLYEIALIAFINWLMGRKDWSAFVEIFGLPNGVVIMPPNIAAGMEDAYQAAAQQVADGLSGALPHGADIKFPSAGLKGDIPFETFCDAQDKDVVLAGTGGLLTMLSMPQGLGHGSSQQHQDAFEEIAHADALKVSEVLQTDFDRVEINEAFPGEPVCVYFELAAKDDEDVAKLADTVVKLEGVGLQTSAEEIGPRVGLALTRVALPNPAAQNADAHIDKSDLNAAVHNALRSAAGKVLNREGAADPAELGDTLHAMILPILKRLEAIAQINDTAIQQHMVEKLLADYPAISQAIQHDQSLAAELSPVLQSHLVAGLTAKPTKE